MSHTVAVLLKCKLAHKRAYAIRSPLSSHLEATRARMLYMNKVQVQHPQGATYVWHRLHFRQHVLRREALRPYLHISLLYCIQYNRCLPRTQRVNCAGALCELSPVRGRNYRRLYITFHQPHSQCTVVITDNTMRIISASSSNYDYSIDLSLILCLI